MSARRPHSEMAELLAAQAKMKSAYITAHADGKDTRPEWVLSLAKRDLSVLQQAADDYRKAAARE